MEPEDIPEPGNQSAAVGPPEDELQADTPASGVPAEPPPARISLNKSFRKILMVMGVLVLVLIVVSCTPLKDFLGQQTGPIAAWFRQLGLWAGPVFVIGVTLGVCLGAPRLFIYPVSGMVFGSIPASLTCEAKFVICATTRHGLVTGEIRSRLSTATVSVLLRAASTVARSASSSAVLRAAVGTCAAPAAVRTHQPSAV